MSPSTATQTFANAAPVSWKDAVLDSLGTMPCGYRPEATAAAEPTALAAWALARAGRLDSAARGVAWLASQQRSDGSITPLAGLNWPGWPTPLSMLAVTALREVDPRRSELSNFDLPRAQEWLLTASGKPMPKSIEFGHDVRLVGWSWATGTHSWIEPTAWSVLALKALGLERNPRTREGVKLLVDRLISTGGCNYGNTIVLGQRLRPHVEPTGLALWALAGEDLDDLRIERSLRFLESTLNAETTAISLAYGVIGLTAHGRRPAQADAWLEQSALNVLEGDRSPLKLALLMLAAQGHD